MDEGLKVSDDEINFVCEKFKVPPKLRYEWDDSWELNLEDIFQNYDERVNHFIKYQQIEEKTEKYLENFAKSLVESELFWAKFISDPSMCQGASYIHIDCLRKDDVLAQRLINAPNDFVYSTLKKPEVLKVQISKVGKLAVYANKHGDIEIEDAYEIKENWLDVEDAILEKLKEAGFSLLTKEQIYKPFAFEFDKKNPTHNTLLDSNLKDYLRQPLLFDFFFYWID